MQTRKFWGERQKIGLGAVLGFFVFSLNFSSIPVNRLVPCKLVMLNEQNVQYAECLSGESTAQAINRLGAQGKVASVSRLYQASLIPNDTYFGKQEPIFRQVNAPAAWEKLRANSLRPVIAVVDSGVDIDNADLKANIWRNPNEIPGNDHDDDSNGFRDDINGWDFVHNVASPKPKFDKGWTQVAINHGTIVAGVAAAVGNNALGIAGVSWNARIMPLRVLDSKGLGDTLTVAKAILYAIDNHADIINLSFVGSESDPILEELIARASRAGILVVAAAGNEQQIGVDMDITPQYPVCDDGPTGDNLIIGVAAVDEHDRLTKFSNFGSRCIDISAPGTKVFSTQYTQDRKSGFGEAYGGYWSGTSVAAPLVSGALALLRSTYPKLSPRELKEIIIASGDSIDHKNSGFERKLGNRLNIGAALELAAVVKFPRQDFIMLTPNSGQAPEVASYELNGDLIRAFNAYTPKFLGGVRAASGQFYDPGQTQIVTVPGPGGGPEVRVFSTTGELINKFMALLPRYSGGLTVAVGDVTNDSIDDIIVGTGSGVLNVIRVFTPNGDMVRQFIPYEGYSQGITVAVGDIDGDNTNEIIVAPVSSRRLPVKVFDQIGRRKLEFFPYSSVGRGGINLAVGDIDGDTKEEIITTLGVGGEPRLRIFNAQGKKIGEFFAYARSLRSGINAVVGDPDGDGVNEIITVPGKGGGPHVRVFNRNGGVRTQFFAGSRTARNGLSLSLTR